jgi:hypothetical protein
MRAEEWFSRCLPLSRAHGGYDGVARRGSRCRARMPQVRRARTLCSLTTIQTSTGDLRPPTRRRPARRGGSRADAHAAVHRAVVQLPWWPCVIAGSYLVTSACCSPFSGRSTRPLRLGPSTATSPLPAGKPQVGGLISMGYFFLPWFLTASMAAAAASGSR